MNIVWFVTLGLALTSFSNVFVYLQFTSAGEDKCECGAFTVEAGQESPGSKEPLLSENPMNITCNEEGTEKCQQICVSLVQLGMERAPELLCAFLKHADPFQPSLWIRCAKDWKYGGLTWKDTICCHEAKPIPCPS